MSTYPHIVGDLNRPTSVHAEMTILGAMLVDPDQVPDAIDHLVAGDFALDSHRKIFAAMVRLAKLSQPIDIVTVSDEMGRKKVAGVSDLDSVGGLSYLASLSEGLPRKLSIDSYVRIVRDKSRARDIITLAQRAAGEAADGQEEAQVVLDRTIQELAELGDSHAGNALQRVDSILAAQGSPEEMAGRMATLGGVRLGFEQVDKNTHGLQPKSLVVVAARPSMGKTAWMCKAARYASVIEEKVTAVFTLEQDKNTMIRRMLSIESRVAYDDILTGNLTPHAHTMLMEQREILMNAPLYLEDQHGLTVTRIKSKCARLKRTVGLDIVFVDQLSKVSDADIYQKGMGKPERVGQQTTALKKMAQELGVPVVVFNQLKRPDGKGGNLPQLSDLKESGSLEEDADVVIFLHRPEYYDKLDENLRDKGQMILAKNREGRTDSFDCTFKGSILRWEDGPVDQRQAYFDAYGADEFTVPTYRD